MKMEPNNTHKSQWWWDDWALLFSCCFLRCVGCCLCVERNKKPPPSCVWDGWQCNGWQHQLLKAPWGPGIDRVRTGFTLIIEKAVRERGTQPVRLLYSRLGGSNFKKGVLHHISKCLSNLHHVFCVFATPNESSKARKNEMLSLWSAQFLINVEPKVFESD